MTSILIVITGARHWTLNDGTKHPTGFWAEEFTAAHAPFVAAGAEVTVATPGGVQPVVDAKSLSPAVKGGDEAAIGVIRDYLDETAGLLAAPERLEDLDPADFDAVFISGGHGPMEDLAFSEELGQLLVAMLDADKVIAAVCHGTAGLVPARRADGQWAFDGRLVTALTTEEEHIAGVGDRAPWFLEDRLRADGAKFMSGPPFKNYVVADGNLVTGQNPMSTADAAQRVLELLA